MDRMKEYPTLTALMTGREPGSVKAQSFATMASWFRPLSTTIDGNWRVMFADGDVGLLKDDGPWLIVSEDARLVSQLLDALEAAERGMNRLRVAYDVYTDVGLRADLRIADGWIKTATFERDTARAQVETLTAQLKTAHRGLTDLIDEGIGNNYTGKIHALQTENAKLRAVVEAAKILAKELKGSVPADIVGNAGAEMIDDLGNALAALEEK